MARIMRVVWEWVPCGGGGFSGVEVGMDAELEGAAAAMGCKPGMTFAFAAISTLVPAGNKYEGPEGIRPTRKSPNLDSSEVLLSAPIPTMTLEGAAVVGSM